MDFIKAVVIVVGMFVLVSAAMYFVDHELFTKTLVDTKTVVDTAVDTFTKK